MKEIIDVIKKQNAPKAPVKINREVRRKMASKKHKRKIQAASRRTNAR